MNELRSCKQMQNTSSPFKTRQIGFLRRHFWSIATSFSVFFIFLFPFNAEATVGSTVALGVAALFYYLVSWAGQLLLLLTSALIFIAQYNGFVTSPAVTNGWVIVRDIANMFFIVSLLLIAFGTMLGFSDYHYSSRLPRLVIMAIVVNFSRTICGLLIDFAQVIMLTFVNGFKEAAGGNFVNAFQISELMQLPPAREGDQENLAIKTAIAMILAFVLITIASGVVLIMIVVLISRIIYLWLLVVLSPLAFLASTVPVARASSFYGRWWDKFNNQIIVGPLMAFFLWLALVSVSSDNLYTDGFPKKDTEISEVSSAEAVGVIQENNVDITKFIISIALLLGGVAMAQEMSQGAVGLGKNILNRAGKIGVGAAKWAGKTAGSFAYKASGAEAVVDKAKERLYTGLGLASSHYRRKAAEQRQLIKSKSTADASLVGQMTDKELEREANKVGVSHSARGFKSAALREQLKRAADPTSGYKMDVNTFHAKRKQGERLDTLTNSDANKGAFDEFAKKNTRYIVDPNSSGAAREKQLNWFKATWKGKSAHSITEANFQDYSPQAMMLAGDQALASGYTRMNIQQQRAMFKALGFNETEEQAFKDADVTGPDRANMVKEKQDRLRRDPKNFEYLDNEQKAALIHERSDKVGQIGLDKIGAIKIDADSMTDDTRDRLARDLGASLSAEDIKKLPNDIAEAIRSTMKTDQPDKYLGAGGKLDALVETFDARTGNVSSPEGQKQLGKFVESRVHASDAIKHMDPRSLVANNGMNDLAIAATARMSANDMDVLAQSDPKRAAATMQALKGISKGNIQSELQSRVAAMRAQNIDESDINEFSDKFIVEFGKAQENARNILEAATKGGVLKGSLSGMTFKGRALKGATAGIEQAVEKMSSSIEGTIETAKSAAKAAGEAIKEAPEATRRAGRKAAGIGRTAKGRAGAFRRRII
jgi:hypothetical protein